MTIVTCDRCRCVCTTMNFMNHVCPGPHDTSDHAYVPEARYQRPATAAEALLWDLSGMGRWPR